MGTDGALETGYNNQTNRSVSVNMDHQWWIKKHGFCVLPFYLLCRSDPWYSRNSEFYDPKDSSIKTTQRKLCVCSNGDIRGLSLQVAHIDDKPDSCMRALEESLTINKSEDNEMSECVCS